MRPEERVRRTGIYAGTFSPFTIGHADIVSRALSIVDTVVILLAINPEKAPIEPSRKRKRAIEQIYSDEPRVIVEEWSGLVADYARQHPAPVLIRGLRQITDLSYEQGMANVHLEKFGLETCFLVTRPGLAYISSSVVRELSAAGVDTSEYIPGSSAKKAYP